MAEAVTDQWRSIDTMPVDERVEVLTFTGIVCPATTRAYHGRLYVRPATRQYPKRRVPCFRADKSGDVSAVAWRPLREGK